MENNFYLYAILDTTTDKLVNIANHGHKKFYESTKRAETAIKNYRKRYSFIKVEEEYLKVVKIRCEVEE